MLDTNVVGEIRVLLRVQPELHAALTRLARRETRSLNGQITHMLRQALPPDLAIEAAPDETEERTARPG